MNLVRSTGLLGIHGGESSFCLFPFRHNSSLIEIYLSYLNSNTSDVYLVVCSDLWGDSGYLKVRMGDRDCGVTTNAGYPIISKTKSMVNNFGDIATNE